MKQRFTVVLLAALLLVAPLPAYAAGEGVGGRRDFAHANRPYGFLHDDFKIVYNGEISWEWLDEVYAGSAIYVPIGIENEEDDTSPSGGSSREEIPVATAATDRNIKDDGVEVSWKATRGAEYVTGVTIVDARREKIDGLPAGAYAKIQTTDNFNSIGKTRVSVVAVLSVNDISYQETEVIYNFSLTNRLVYIDSNSVYGARLPTMFQADYGYSGRATFDMGGGVKFNTYVNSEERYVIAHTTEPDEVLEKRYPDAELEFHIFNGDNDTFAAAGTLEIPLNRRRFTDDDDRLSLYVYRGVAGERAAEVPYAIEGDTIVIATQTLDDYVLSNMNLSTYEMPAPAPEGQTPAIPAVPAVTPQDPLAPPTGGGDAPPAVPVGEQAGAASVSALPSSSAAAQASRPAPTAPVRRDGMIRAVNVATQNPLTGPGGVILPLGGALALAMAVAAALAIGKKK